MRLLFIFLFISSNVSFSFTQNIAEIKSNRALYIWGEGSGTTLKSADNAALSDLISQISTQVENNFQQSIEQTSTDKKISIKQVVNDVVKTYSSATLTNTTRLVIENEPNAKVFRYIRKSEIARIFESRKNKIIEFAHNGEKALSNLQIADALRYLYWAQTLLRSHPNSGEITMTDESGKNTLLITWLPAKINEIFDRTSVAIESVEKKSTYTNCLLSITYDGKSVRNFDYTYWDGQNWSNIVSAADGLGVVELPITIDGSAVRIKCEYSFEGEANIDGELRNVIETLPAIPYKNAYKNVTKISCVPIANVQQAKQTASIETSNLQKLENCADKESIMQKITAAIELKKYDEVKNLFTNDGYSVFQSLLQYGNAKILKKVKFDYYPFKEYIICRSLPVSFNFTTNNRTFVENVVFYFEKSSDKICNISFSLSMQSLDDIALNCTWSNENRLQLMTFLENYKTAYSLKRFEYINNIFSDDALIITGMVTKINTNPEQRYTNNGIVKYNRQTKSEYMKKLKYSFDSNEYINIRFADNTIRRSGKGNDVFGIQIKQDYFSTNYGDSGYLFLLVDLNDDKKPQIHVRTWQPEKNLDGSIYSLSDF